MQTLTRKLQNYLQNCPLSDKAFITICPSQHKIFTGVNKKWDEEIVTIDPKTKHKNK